MGDADDRNHMMLAIAFNADILKDNHFVIAVYLFEGACEIGVRVFIVTRKKFKVGADNPVRRAAQTFPRRIISRPADQGTDSVFRLCLGRTVLCRSAGVSVLVHETCFLTCDAPRISEEMR